ncbi:MAG TPA: hypothetical protein VHW25_12850, partial [Steroidobacteraceae bacterium]|nr:hypothetical protein [Steroidobacteraceae bacterium]
TTLNLLLDRYSHHLGVLNLQLAHRLPPREKNEAIIALCCIIYVVVFNMRWSGRAVNKVPDQSSHAPHSMMLWRAAQLWR